MTESKIYEVRIQYQTEGYTKTEVFNNPEEFLQFLIDLDIYDDIQATKHFSTGKRVIERMKGGG